MLNKIAFYILAATFIVACNNPSNKNMIDGYEYIVHDKGTGQKVNVGDYVSFTLKIEDDKGNILQEASSEPLPAIQVPEGEVPKNPGSQVISLIAQSTIGDSLSLIMPKDSLKNMLPPGQDSLKHLAYVMRLVRAQSKEDYEAEQEKIRQEAAAQAELLKARELEVKDFVAEVNASIKNGSADIQDAEQGLKYIMHEEGTGVQPKVGDKVQVLYYGTLDNGDMFDNAFSRGKEFEFTIGRGMVIKGWDLGIPLLKEGGKATLIIPSELGYGEAGAGANIPGGSTLHFYVELVKVN
jgi:FKBP-type peptidyl-prolyl cis-trans isomerase FkpA